MNIRASCHVHSSFSTRYISALGLVTASVLLQGCGSSLEDSVDDRADALSVTRSGPGYELVTSTPTGSTSASQVWTFADAPTLLVPGTLDNFEGADGDSKATLTFKSATGAVTCSYASSPVASAQTLRDLLPTTRLNLSGCSPDAKIGTALKSVASVSLAVRRAASQTTLSTRVTLPVSSLRRNAADDEIGRQVVLFKHSKFPGELVIDASDGRLVYPTSDAGRTYADRPALVVDVARVFGGKVTTVNGQPSSVKLSVSQLGKIRFIGKGGLLEPKSKDLLSVYLGGLGGLVTIGSKAIPVNAPIDFGTVSQGFSAPPPPPESVDVCAGKMCTHNYSFHNDYRIYESIGGQIDITSGGYEEHSYLCLTDWGIPWVCTRRTGWSNLSVSPVYWGSGDHGACFRTGDRALTRSERNVESVESKLWAVFGSVEFDSSGAITNGDTGANVVAGAVRTGHLFDGEGAVAPPPVETSNGTPCTM